MSSVEVPSHTPAPLAEAAPAALDVPVEPEPSPWAARAGEPVAAIAGHFPELRPTPPSLDAVAPPITEVRRMRAVPPAPPTAPETPRARRGPKKKHDPIEIGDVFGEFKVEREVARRASNRRFELVCARGHKRVAIVFNLRARPDQKCRECVAEKREEHVVAGASPWLGDASKLPKRPPGA